MGVLITGRGSEQFDVTAADYGYKAMNCDPALASVAQTFTAGVQFFVRVNLPETITVTTISVGVATVGASFANTTTLAIYSEAGSKLVETGDLASVLNATGVKSGTVSSTTLPGGRGRFCVVGYLCGNGTGTAPQLYRLPNAGGAYGTYLNTGLGSVGKRSGSNGTGQSPPQATSPTISDNSNVFWVGLS